MPMINWNNVGNAGEFSPLPEDRYLFKVTKVEESATRNGDEMWRLTLSVVEGEFKGRSVLDNMVFSDAALGRAKLICSRLGLDVTGEVDLTPNMLEGRECLVDVVVEEYTDGRGSLKRRNTVPFAGYHATEETETPAGDSDVPF